jgi:hypothetical protein
MCVVARVTTAAKIPKRKKVGEDLDVMLRTPGLVHGLIVGAHVGDRGEDVRLCRQADERREAPDGGAGWVDEAESLARV